MLYLTAEDGSSDGLFDRFPLLLIVLDMRVFMALYPTHELRIVDRKGGWERFKQRNVARVAA